MSFVYKSKILCHLYCWISQVRNPGFKREVERRSKSDIFDYKTIAQPLPKCYYEICTDNNCFGIGWSLRNYAGLMTKPYISAMVEHGYFFGKYVQDLERVTFANKILTFSDVRKSILESEIKGKEIISIGPYIHYAPQYYDEIRLKKEKQKLGKVLLVFFSHSATGVSVSFDLDYIIDKINTIKNDFDTVVVSLFWSDINPTIEERLIKEGYKIFSSGHRFDYYFLSRQKTMISLADMTMSNSVGTHLAYCTYLKKPHWLIKQEIKETALNKTGEANISIANNISDEDEASKEIDLFYKTLSEYSKELSSSQIDVCNKYFGLKCIKTPDEIKEII